MQSMQLDITSQEYEKIAKLVYSRFGINLGEKKQSLVINRLRKVLIENKFNNFDQFYDYILNDRSGAGLDTLINKISTNLTYFAREQEHFDYFKGVVLPELVAKPAIKNERSLRIWCAGCSTGEEAYTLAMILNKSSLASSDWNLGVLASDISARALDVAKTGIYSGDNVEKLDEATRRMGFEKSGLNKWRVRDDIKNIVLFRRLNLMRSDFPFKRKFHTIFCRNVMIYFDNQTRKILVEKFHHYLADGGYLFIGHSESLGRDNAYFKYIRPAVYQKVKQNG